MATGSADNVGGLGRFVLQGWNALNLFQLISMGKIFLTHKCMDL